MCVIGNRCESDMRVMVRLEIQSHNVTTLNPMLSVFCSTCSRAKDSDIFPTCHEGPSFNKDVDRRLNLLFDNSQCTLYVCIALSRGLFSGAE